MNPDKLPTILHYDTFLQKICKKEKISKDEARKKYGQFTYKEWWAQLLKGTKKLPWNGLHKEVTYHRQPTKSEIRFGHGGLYELAEFLTDKFELLNKGKTWDGNWFDEIESFLNAELHDSKI